jgi:hypothetical protein
MFQWEVLFKYFPMLLFLFSIGAMSQPPPETRPALKYKPSLNDDGLRHAWRGWEPVDLDSSNLEGYAKKKHDEMHEQSWKGGFREVDMPCCMASLHIPKEGVYSASDYGHYSQRPLGTPPQLHPNTKAILYDNSLRLNDHAGSCAEIQALDAYHRKFPDKPIPAGTCIAIWGRRNMCHAPKLQTACGRNCKKILQATGIKCLDKPKKVKIAKPRRRKQSKPMRAQLDQGAAGMPAGAGPATMPTAHSFGRKLRAGRKTRKFNYIDNADTEAQPQTQGLGGPNPKRGKANGGVLQSTSSEDSKGTGGTSPTAGGAAAHSFPGPDPDRQRPDQKYRTLGEIYRSDEVAEILLQDLPQGDAI